MLSLRFLTPNCTIISDTVNFILNLLSVYSIFTDCENDPYGQLFILLLLWKSYYRVMAKGKGGNSSNSQRVHISINTHTQTAPTHL